VKIYNSDRELVEVDGVSFLVITLEPGELVQVGAAKVMVRRVKGKSVRLLIAAPEDLVVRREKLVQDL